MKKTGIVILGLILILNLSAQKTVNFFKSDLTVLNLVSTDIDSVKFSSNNSQLEIFKQDNSTTGINISVIDSITFSDQTPHDLPVLSNINVISVLNTTISCSFNLLSTGGTTITEKGICWSTSQNPTIEINKLTSTSSDIAIEISGLTAQTTYFLRPYAINTSGISYGNQIEISTTNYTLPSVETVSATYNYSTNSATCVVKVNSNGGCALTERGICWSTSQNPTINNSKFASGISVGQFYAIMSNLNVNSTYYVRSFATNCIGTTYGTQLKVQALMGNLTYTIQSDLATTQPTYYNLIKTAMDSACWYYNRYTTFRGNIYVYYNAGIPTAQASYHGSIGFGPSTSYMWVGTAMHEVAHFVGSGTTSAWQSKLSAGVWTGTVASDLLKSWTGEVLKGDNNSNPIHFWPYGINYKTEITNLGSQANQQEALIRHAKLVKAMVVDDAKVPNSW